MSDPLETVWVELVGIDETEIREPKVLHYPNHARYVDEIFRVIKDDCNAG
jgi:hypothetical protein